MSHVLPGKQFTNINVHILYYIVIFRIPAPHNKINWYIKKENENVNYSTILFYIVLWKYMKSKSLRNDAHNLSTMRICEVQYTGNVMITLFIQPSNDVIYVNSFFMFGISIIYYWCHAWYPQFDESYIFSCFREKSYCPRFCCCISCFLYLSRCYIT